MAKQTKIIIETDSLLILRGQSSRRAWCPLCAAEEEMIALEKHRSDFEPGKTRTGGMAQFRRAAPVAGCRWLDSDLPEFTAGSRPEKQKPANCGMPQWRTTEKETT